MLLVKTNQDVCMYTYMHVSKHAYQKVNVHVYMYV